MVSYVSSSSYDMTCMYPPPHNLVSLHWHAGTASVLAVVQDPRAVHTGRFAAYRSVWKTREVWRERELNSGPKQHFSKVLHVVALYSRDTRVLTFETVWQPTQMQWHRTAGKHFVFLSTLCSEFLYQKYSVYSESVCKMVHVVDLYVTWSMQLTCEGGG